jgi:hypothetical protein
VKDSSPNFWELPPNKRRNKHKIDPKDWYPPAKWDEFKAHHVNLLSHLSSEGTWMFPRSLTILEFQQDQKTYEMRVLDVTSDFVTEFVRLDVPTSIRVFSDIGFVPTKLTMPYRYLRVAQNSLFRLIPSDHPALKGKRWWYDTKKPDSMVEITLIPDDNQQ